MKTVQILLQEWSDSYDKSMFALRIQSSLGILERHEHIYHTVFTCASELSSTAPTLLYIHLSPR